MYLDREAYKPYERKVAKKSSQFYKMALEEKLEFHQKYEKDTNQLELFQQTPELKEYIVHFEERNSRFYHRLDRIIQNETNLIEFSKGYKQYGFSQETDGTLYREWAPESTSVSLLIDGEKIEGSKVGPNLEVVIPKVDGEFRDLRNSRITTIIDNHEKISCWARRTTEHPHQYQIQDNTYEFNFQPPKILQTQFYELNFDKYIDALKTIDEKIQEGFNTFIVNILEHNEQNKVSHYFAPSYRHGNLTELEQLVDFIHSRNSQIVLNFPLQLEQGSQLIQYDGSQYHYFTAGMHEPHLDFDKWELNRYLLSSISYWVDIFKFDGIRFPNLKDIILLNPKHPGDIKELLLDNSRIEALVFIMFANDVVHQIKQDAITIGSGLPDTYPGKGSIKYGGLGFDYVL